MVFTVGKMFVMLCCVQIFTCQKQFLKSLFITKCMNMLFATRIINFFVLRRIRALKVVMKCEIVAVVIVNVVVLSTPFCISQKTIFVSILKQREKQLVPLDIGQWHLICLLMAFFFTHFDCYHIDGKKMFGIIADARTFIITAKAKHFVVARQLQKSRQDRNREP